MDRGHSFPRFTNSDSRLAFVHWVKQKDCNGCSLCQIMQNIIQFGTSKMLPVLFRNFSSFTKGSNMACINLGKITYKGARKVLELTDHHNCDDDFGKKHMIELISHDFPGLNVTHLSEEKEFYPYIHLMNPECNTLYLMLSSLYKKALRLRPKIDITPLSVCEFVLLCCHLSRQYLLTPDSVNFMWTHNLRFNCITTLLGETDNDMRNILKNLSIALGLEK